MTHPRSSARSAPFLSSGTLRELSEAARAAGTGQVLDELWTARRFLDGTPAAVAVLDADLRYLYLNDTLAEFNGLPVDEHLGRPMPEVIPGSGPSAEVAREVLRTGRPQTVVFDGRVPDPTVDVPRWWLGAFHRLDGEDGEILGVAAVVMEITEGIRQRESLSRARERLELLEETAARVGGTLDAAEACRALTDLLVPRFADYAAVDVLDPEGTRRAPATPVPVRLRRMAVAAAPGLPEPLTPATRSGEVIFHQASSSMSQVLTAHKPVVLNRPDDDTLRMFAPTRQRLERYRALELHSVACLPLMVGGEPVGAVMLGRRAHSPEFTPDDVELLELLTARAATGIGHALRYTHEHETALEMQRAFLATPHIPGPGVEIASRYLPAGRGFRGGRRFFRRRGAALRTHPARGRGRHGARGAGRRGHERVPFAAARAGPAGARPRPVAHRGGPHRPRARPGPCRHLCAGPPGPRRRTRSPGHRRPCPAPAGPARRPPRARGPAGRPSPGHGVRRIREPALSDAGGHPAAGLHRRARGAARRGHRHEPRRTGRHAHRGRASPAGHPEHRPRPAGPRQVRGRRHAPGGPHPV
ncbi:LOW QUALITY PROTEIN: magnesium or manganese-dependent protein phosphatase, partial [Streptomyces sviceus ATCC 29083]